MASLSFGDGIPEESLKADFGNVTVVPPQVPDLGFQIALPRSWVRAAGVEGKGKLEEERLDVLAAFAGPGQAAVQILGTLIPYEVNLMDWLDWQAGIIRAEIGEHKSGETDYGQMVHAVATSAVGEPLRIVVVGSGPNVAMLLGTCAADADERVWETLGLAAATFGLLNVPALKTREPLKVYTDKDGMFELLHPASWTTTSLNDLRPEKAGVDLRLASKKDTLAYLRIEADKRYSRDDAGLKELYELTLDEITDSGVDVTHLEAVPPGPTAGERQRWVGECELPSGIGSIAILFRPVADAWLSAVMISPALLAHPLAWLRGKRAYEIAVASLQRP
jgi:hypothetical protein